jgi:tetratricopeptide (TPR) repeat protein
LEKKQNFIYILLIATVNLLLFLPAMRGDFVWDDRSLVTENVELKNPAFLARFLRLPFGETDGADPSAGGALQRNAFYRPLTMLSYWIDFKIWGLNPAGFHLTNILLHVINALLLFLILRMLPWGRFSAFAAALLFSVFPLHFENVAWISGRTDLLSFLFAAAAILSLTRFLKFTGYRWLFLSAAFFLSALLCKENAAAAGVAMAVLLACKSRHWKEWTARVSPLLLAVFFWLVLRQRAIGFSAVEFSAVHLCHFFSAIGYSMFRTVWPFFLSVSVNSDHVFGNPLYAGAGVTGAFIFSLSLFFLLARDRRHPVHWFVFTFGLLLLPSVLIVFSPDTVSSLAWRFLYVPSAVFVSALTVGAKEWIRKPAVALILLLGLGLAYGAEIYPKNRLFGKTENDFWTGIPHVERESWVVQCNIGATYLARNDERKALAIFRRLLSVKAPGPGDGVVERVYGNLADFYLYRRELEKASGYFAKLLQGNPNPGLRMSFRYASFLAMSGRNDEAERIVEKWLHGFPRRHAVLLAAAGFYWQIHRRQRCEELLRRDEELFGSGTARELLKKMENDRPGSPPREPGN